MPWTAFSGSTHERASASNRAKLANGESGTASGSARPCLMPARSEARTGMSVKTFLLPDLGEGLADAEIVRWLVAEGDDVRIDQPVVEVETAKSVVEVPTPFAGRVV